MMIGLFHGMVAVILASASPTEAAKSADTPAKPLLADIQRRIDQHAAQWVELYKNLHANPELSHHEVRTAARLAGQLRESGFTVSEKVGGTGIVGILEHGAGRTVMVRTDLDALPVTERTGLPYASQVTVRDADGNAVGVMHACGHDIHMTCWVGVATVLAELCDHWHGRLMFVGQPAEERGSGARDMLKDGLFVRFPKPDFALALHCEPFLPHGMIGYTEGMALANVDSVDIRVVGKGGHGAAPHATIDPIVIAARIVLDLQTLVSREVDPLDSAVVTVGSIHGGSKHNIIPSEVRLQLTVRSFKETTRKHLLDGIARIAKAAAAAARAPEPEVKVDANEFTPALANDPELTRRIAGVFRSILGPEKVTSLPPVMGGEDFSRYGREGVPILLFRVGTIAPARVEEARAGGPLLPSLHSDRYQPVPEPSIRTGVLAMTAAVIDLLAK